MVCKALKFRQLKNVKFGQILENFEILSKLCQNCDVCTVKCYLWVYGDYMFVLGGYLGDWVTVICEGRSGGWEGITYQPCSFLPIMASGIFNLHE